MFEIILQEPPFVERVNKSVTLKELVGKVSDGVLQGFLIDVIKELSKEANFDYEIHLSKKGYAGVIDQLKNQVNHY